MRAEERSGPSWRSLRSSAPCATSPFGEGCSTGWSRTAPPRRRVGTRDCTGCLLSGILAKFPYKFKCLRCGGKVETWTRFKPDKKREAANKDPSLRVGAPGDLAGGKPRGSWIMPGKVLEYFSAGRAEQLEGSALCLVYSREDTEEVQVGGWRLRTDLGRPALTVAGNEAHNELVDAVGVQLHHAWGSRAPWT
jgi:hypothetical protein